LRHGVKGVQEAEGENLLSNQKPDSQVGPTVSLHRMLNRLAMTEVGDAFINGIASALLEQMEDGYRFVVPLSIRPGGQVLRCVALLALVNDPRLRAFRQLRISPGATHVLVFQAYASEGEWLKQVNLMAKLFPEQPDKPEFILAE
jgi:hypothetical protein